MCVILLYMKFEFMSLLGSDLKMYALRDLTPAVGITLKVTD